MKTLSKERSPRTIVRLLTNTFLACLVASVCVVALPGLAVGPASDAQKAYDEWVAANEAVKEARKNAQDAKDKLANTMAVSATGGITEGEEKALAKARDEVAKAEAALKDAEAKFDAARIELEKAIAELEDEKLKKELIRKRDGYIAAQRFTAIAPAKASVETKSGLHTVSFDTSLGRVIVNLPDDMRAGDTISGTVVTEPQGTNSEEKAKNDEALKLYVIDIQGSRSPVGNGGFTFDAPLAQPQVGEGDRSNEGKMDLGLFSGASLWGKAVVPYRTPSGAVVTPDPVQKTPSGAVVTPDPKFTIPNLGQQGRSIVINGPFDGNAANTTLRYGPADRTVHEFVKQSDSVSEGSGFLRTLAESPRKIVFESPTNVTGPIGIMVKEGNGPPTTGIYRNVGVSLSAPKTNLLKGEKTTLTVQVSGLEGIKEPVPLTLESKGVITMEGGIYQPLIIQPSQVGADGRYTTTRGITGVQTGGWEATATVVTGRFNVWLQDDTDPNRLFHFNSFTGEYIFACGGGSCRTGGSTGGTQTGGTTGKPGGTTPPGGTVQPGGTTPPGGTGTPPIVPPPPVTLTGVGKPVMKGCIITLSHNAPDRRVFARLDACSKTGDASVQTNSPKAEIKITDKNTTDNTAGSPPPK